MIDLFRVDCFNRLWERSVITGDIEDFFFSEYLKTLHDSPIFLHISNGSAVFYFKDVLLKCVRRCFFSVEFNGSACFEFLRKSDLPLVVLLNDSSIYFAEISNLMVERLQLKGITFAKNYLLKRFGFNGLVCGSAANSALGGICTSFLQAHNIFALLICNFNLPPIYNPPFFNWKSVNFKDDLRRKVYGICSDFSGLATGCLFNSNQLNHHILERGFDFFEIINLLSFLIESICEGRITLDIFNVKCHLSFTPIEFFCSPKFFSNQHLIFCLNILENQLNINNINKEFFAGVNSRCGFCAPFPSFHPFSFLPYQPSAGFAPVNKFSLLKPRSILNKKFDKLCNVSYKKLLNSKVEGIIQSYLDSYDIELSANKYWKQLVRKF